MPRKKMWVEYEDGAELSRSQKRPGYASPLTRDGDNKLGQVTLSDVDEDEEDSVAGGPVGFDAYGTYGYASKSRAEELAELAETIEVLNSLVNDIYAAAPHVIRWWHDEVRPAIKSTKESLRNKFARTRKAGPPARDTAVVMFVDAATENSSKEVESAPRENRSSMSRDEAQQRLAAALLARAFSDEQIRLLLSARIEDADGYLELKSLVQEFTPEEVVGRVNRMLEGNPSLLDDFLKLSGANDLATTQVAPRSERPKRHYLRLVRSSDGSAFLGRA